MRISKHLNGNTFREGVGGKQLIMHILPLSLYLCNAPASSYNTVVLEYIRPRLSAAGSGAEAIRLDAGERSQNCFRDAFHRPVKRNQFTRVGDRQDENIDINNIKLHLIIFHRFYNVE